MVKQPPYPTGRLARWGLELQGYDIEIIHRKGALHHVPDALSRMSEGDEVPVASVGDTQDSWYLRRIQAVEERPKTFPNWKVEDGMLYRHKPNMITDDIVPDLVLPKELRQRVIEESHTAPQAGHLGNEKTYQRVALRYYWPGIFVDVVDFVKTCSPCQKSKVEQARPVGMMGHRVVEQPWTVVAGDVMGPFPKSKAGYRYILVFQDLFTKWIECLPIRTANGPTIRKAFEDLIVSSWGTPEVIHTDNGTEFTNRLLEQMCNSIGIIHTTNPVYHAQANSTERVNRVLKTMIISFLRENHKEWDLHLSEFRFAYNTAVHGTLKVSPTFLNFGRNPLPYRTMRKELDARVQHNEPKPSEWAERVKRLDHLRDLICRNLDRAYETQAKYYNASKRDRSFKVGDLVLRSNRKLSKKADNVAGKLFPKFEGSLRVKRRLSPIVYTLAYPNGKFAGFTQNRSRSPHPSSRSRTCSRIMNPLGRPRSSSSASTRTGRTGSGRAPRSPALTGAPYRGGVGVAVRSGTKALSVRVHVLRIASDAGNPGTRRRPARLVPNYTSLT